MSKSIKQILLFNCIAILLLSICIEFGFYAYFCKRIYNINPFVPVSHYKKEFTIYPPPYFVPIEQSQKKYSKKPILLLGGSYAQGEGLDPSETNFTAQISKLTNRYAYNWGISGQGALAMLALLKDEHKRHLLTDLPEYVIYLYMFHHIERCTYWQHYNLMRKEGLIPFQKYNFLYNFYIYQYFKNIEADKYFWNDFNRRYDVFFSVLKKMKEESDNLFPKSKFVILLYSDTNYDIWEGIMGKNNENKETVNHLFEILYSKDFRHKLEDLGFIVISTEELTGRKMNKPKDRVKNDPCHPHPSESAWKEILPKFVKKLHL